MTTSTTMILVDEFKRWAPTRIRCFRAGSCHLTHSNPTGEGALEELHAFADSIGLRRAWFQDGRIPHYDLTESRREAAIALGALFVSARDQAKSRIATRL